MCLLAPGGPARARQAGKGLLKVFILAGQSNMEGQGKVDHLGKLAADPEKDKTFKHLLAKDGKWAVRDDVWICYFGRCSGVKKGALTVGYGANDALIGPELQFGHVVGDHFDNQVLLIKIAWGGKSLAKDSRPPSSGGEVGPYYKKVLAHVREALVDIKKYFPDYDGRGYEIAGLGWHQGWNDRVNQAYNDAYEENLSNFIRDIRKDLGVKDLPFVIAETGMHGPEEKHPRALSLMKAQSAVAKRPEFKGNVAFVKTTGFWRPPEVSPSRQGYQWCHNAGRFS